MIIKIKTFSGETLYIPEEDYLNEVMYSDLEERDYSKPLLREKQVKEAAEKVGLSVEKYIKRQRALATRMRTPSGDVNRLLSPEEDKRIMKLMGKDKYYRVNKNIVDHYDAGHKHLMDPETIAYNKLKVDKINRGTKSAVAKHRLKERAEDLRYLRSITS